MPETTSVEIDDDEPDQHGELIRRAIAHVRQVAANDPELAARGFGIAVTDERDRVIFKVIFGTDESAVTVH